ncbi:hypothetical protein [Leisingera sp. ANG-M7]|uniref:hypothetical protein n=1 Tax=Leisingera sp. ANG-M7 TaxID=1577902 RepID=UPI00187CB7C6|nr:hypothetical protein [Leisingera sp. ANG-M7]
MSFLPSAASRAFAAVAFLGGLAGCETVTPVPPSEPERASAVSEASVRTIAFAAEWAPQEAKVAAQCLVEGPEFKTFFATPAKLKIPVDDSGRAALTLVRCDYNGVRAEWTAIPGVRTMHVNARFGGTGLLGENTLIFGRLPGQVQYFVLDGKLISVGNAPAP